VSLESVIDTLVSDPAVIAGVVLGAVAGVFISRLIARRLKYRRTRRKFVEQVWDLSRIEDYGATKAGIDGSPDVVIDLTALEAKGRHVGDPSGTQLMVGEPSRSTASAPDAPTPIRSFNGAKPSEPSSPSAAER
jgi:hypothetical protein